MEEKNVSQWKPLQSEHRRRLYYRARNGVDHTWSFILRATCVYMNLLAAERLTGRTGESKRLAGTACQFR